MTMPEPTESLYAVPVARPAPVDVASKFPASVVAGPGRRGRRRARAVAAVAVVAVVVVGGGLVMRASASGPTSYRTAVASQRDVDSLLNSVATIEPVSQATVGFPVAGTVATVDVAVGDAVTAGQTLATLDVTALTAALHEKQAALDAANLTLQRALNGESVAPTGTRSFSMAPATLQVTLYAATADDANTDLAAAQQAVLAAQHDVDTARAQAATALASATTVCAAIGVDVTTDPAATLTSINACQTALQAVVTAQTAVSDAQTALATASSALDVLLTQLAAQLPPPTTAPPTTEPPTTEPPSSEPPSSGPSSS